MCLKVGIAFTFPYKIEYFKCVLRSPLVDIFPPQFTNNNHYYRFLLIFESYFLLIYLYFKTVLEAIIIINLHQKHH